MNPPFEPCPDERTQPAVHQCHVMVRDLNSVSLCKKAWDRKHTALGFAVCGECWGEIREP